MCAIAPNRISWRVAGLSTVMFGVQAISLWDSEAGMTQIDKYTYSEDPAVVAGACLGFGLCCCSVRSELDPAFALLSEHVHRYAFSMYPYCS